MTLHTFLTPRQSIQTVGGDLGNVLVGTITTTIALRGSEVDGSRGHLVKEKIRVRIVCNTVKRMMRSDLTRTLKNDDSPPSGHSE